MSDAGWLTENLPDHMVTVPPEWNHLPEGTMVLVQSDSPAPRWEHILIRSGRLHRAMLGSTCWTFRQPARWSVVELPNEWPWPTELEVIDGMFGADDG